MSEFPTQVGADSADKMVVEVGTANKPAAAERSALSVIERVLGRPNARHRDLLEFLAERRTI